jgi:hypothetical protein
LFVLLIWKRRKGSLQKESNLQFGSFTIATVWSSEIPEMISGRLGMQSWFWVNHGQARYPAHWMV